MTKILVEVILIGVAVGIALILLDYYVFKGVIY
jgi:hypothetical protein